MKMEQTECSETSEYKIQMPGNYSGESIQHSEHGESMKSRDIWLSGTHNIPVGAQIQGDVHDAVYKYITFIYAYVIICCLHVVFVACEVTFK